jgi:hypothetical protein
MINEQGERDDRYLEAQIRIEAIRSWRRSRLRLQIPAAERQRIYGHRMIRQIGRGPT